MIETPNRFVKPSVYLVGKSVMCDDGVKKFLTDSDNLEFWDDIVSARSDGLSDAEIMSSLFAKMCYRSLTVKHNSNVTRVRDIEPNLKNMFNTGHGSVFEHVWFNFIVDDCSRVFTHELVRHRVGTAFSQTSGRYCRIDQLNIVWDPILDPVKDLWNSHLALTEDLIYLTECKLGLRKPNDKQPGADPEHYIKARKVTWEGPASLELKWVPDDAFNFEKRKKITSAIRRIAPNGQENEIGFSVNLRALRHTMLMRTAAFAEWEIRYVFAEIYHALKLQFPMMFYGAKERQVEGITEVYGMKCQPYEKSAEMVLDEMTDQEVALFVKTRPNVMKNLTA